MFLPHLSTRNPESRFKLSCKRAIPIHALVKDTSPPDPHFQFPIIRHCQRISIWTLLHWQPQDFVEHAINDQAKKKKAYDSYSEPAKEFDEDSRDSIVHLFKDISRLTNLERMGKVLQRGRRTLSRSQLWSRRSPSKCSLSRLCTRKGSPKGLVRLSGFQRLSPAVRRWHLLQRPSRQNTERQLRGEFLDPFWSDFT